LSSDPQYTTFAAINETALLSELRISSDYLKQWLPDGKLTLTV